MISVPDDAANRAAAAMRCVIETVVFGLITLMRILLAPIALGSEEGGRRATIDQIVIGYRAIRQMPVGDAALPAVICLIIYPGRCPHSVCAIGLHQPNYEIRGKFRERRRQEIAIIVRIVRKHPFLPRPRARTKLMFASSAAASLSPSQ